MNIVPTLIRQNHLMTRNLLHQEYMTTYFELDNISTGMWVNQNLPAAIN